VRTSFIRGHSKGEGVKVMASAVNPYTFDAFLDRREQYDFYRDDSFFQNMLQKYASQEWDSLHPKLLEFSPKVSFRWKTMTERIARPDVHPYMLHYDAFNHRIDRIVRPMETLRLEKEIFAEGLFKSAMSPWEHFAKRFLLSELGEFGVMCPIACTDGLIALIEQFPDPSVPELALVLQHCKEGIDGDFGIGAQYMSEIQGGSDIPANRVEAVRDGNVWRLYGNKFFCSATHADYAVVTAKASDTGHIRTFIVPSWLPGDKEKERRNGHTIQRLKWKMGTAELPTAEIQYHGAVAYPVGPPERGVAVAVGIVLTLSRLSIGIGSAASMLRAAREARMYSEFREVFGRKIAEYPLAARQLRDLDTAARRTTAGAFKVYDLFVRLGKTSLPGWTASETREIRKKRFQLRELILLQKITTAKEAVDVLRKAMSIFGGHGVMEDFSSLPRLLRDAMVNELWEGPRNVLLTQIYRDLGRAAEWYDPSEFVRDVLEGVADVRVEPLASQLPALLRKPVIADPHEDAMEAAGEWETFCDTLFTLYQQQALDEWDAAP
jgi:alkylation response protein AidB-like acyl-CoA dehydrogenase